MYHGWAEPISPAIILLNRVGQMNRRRKTRRQLLAQSANEIFAEAARIYEVRADDSVLELFGFNCKIKVHRQR